VSIVLDRGFHGTSAVNFLTKSFIRFTAFQSLDGDSNVFQHTDVPFQIKKEFGEFQKIIIRFQLLLMPKK
jgi:hypothetical protein